MKQSAKHDSRFFRRRVTLASLLLLAFWLIAQTLPSAAVQSAGADGSGASTQLSPYASEETVSGDVSSYAPPRGEGVSQIQCDFVIRGCRMKE